MRDKMLNFESDWSWRGKGQLSNRFRQCTSTHELFSALIAEEKEAGKSFETLYGNDNKLIGQERYDLAEELEDILGGFFQLYRLFSKAEKSKFISHFTPPGKNFIIEFDGPLWRAEGVLKMPSVKGSFTDWFNKILLPQTALFIKTYGLSLADGVISSEEQQSILEGLNDLIHQVLNADKNLKSGNLS